MHQNDSGFVHLRSFEEVVNNIGVHDTAELFLAKLGTGS